MILRILRNREIKDLQNDFTEAYAYLRIEFYKKNVSLKLQVSNAKKRFDNSITIGAAGSINEGEIVLEETMTVSQLENIFRDKFGLLIQLSRKSGIIWLETTMTNNWTLKQQNDHGRELSRQ